jgi:transcriptional regulator with XRE-family HTH domain
MTPAQLRMARAALGMTVREIEKKTGVNKNTVVRYEGGREILSGALQRLETLFLDAGVIFLEADEAGREGIRVHPMPNTKRAKIPVRTSRKSSRTKVPKRMRLS